MRIVFLGDSLTWGGYGGNFVAEVAKLLPQHTIINSGAGGNTVINLRQRLDTVLERHEPDGVFVMVGGNDAISYTYPAVRPYYQQVQKIPDGFVPPDTFAQTYRDLLTHIQLSYAKAWVGLEPCEYNPMIVTAINQYNDAVRTVAQTLNIPVLDFPARFDSVGVCERAPLTLGYITQIGERERTGWQDYEGERQREGYSFTFDGFHITPQTAQTMAQGIVEFLDL